jgi:ribonuclease HI
MTQEALTQAVIFTDGACLGNPGPGGYAAVVSIAGDEQIIVGSDTATTNNKMEMTAAIKALEAVPSSLPIVIHSDSQYVINGATKWIKGWKAKGWRKPVLNQDLWRQMDGLLKGRKITWQWVKGHAGHEQNERVDGLANAEAQKAADALGQIGQAR